MGSSSSKSASTPPSLNSTQLASYTNTRANLFKGTIAVAVIYAALSILILLLIIFHPGTRDILGGTIRPFTITFIIGMILVISILTYNVVSWKFTPVAIPLNSDICPDYYKAAQSPSSVINNANGNNKGYLNFQCIQDTSVYSPISGTDPISVQPTNYKASLASGVDPATDLYNLQQTINTNITDNSNKLSCSTLYPQVLALNDSNNYPNAPTSIRCQWAKTCGVPWTGVCPTAIS